MSSSDKRCIGRGSCCLSCVLNTFIYWHGGFVSLCTRICRKTLDVRMFFRRKLFSKFVFGSKDKEFMVGSLVYIANYNIYLSYSFTLFK